MQTKEFVQNHSLDQLRELCFEVRGLQLAGLRCGPVRPAVVLALHGWLDNAASFLPLAEALPDLPVIALDLPGHGRSGHRPPGCGYAIWDYVGDVMAVIDQLSGIDVHLLGHSMGAGIASLLAGAFPDCIGSLVLIEAVAPLTTPDTDAPEQLARAIQWRTQGVRPPTLYRSPERMIQARMKGRFPLSEAAAAGLTWRGARQVDGGWCWSHDPRLLAPSDLRLSEAQARAFLTRINVPAQLYLAHGGIATVQTHERAACIQQLELVKVKGGHHPHLEAGSLPEMVEPLGAFYKRMGVLASTEDA